MRLNIIGCPDRPTPEISWQKDGGELPSSRVSLHNFNKMLKISDVSEADAGNYHCTAANSVGTAHHTIKVTVKGMNIFSVTSCFLLYFRNSFPHSQMFSR